MAIAKRALLTQIAGIYRLSNANHSPQEGQGKLSPDGMSEGSISVPQTGHVLEYRDIASFTLSKALTVSSDLLPYPILERRSFTRSDNALPSTVFPRRWVFAALITAPMALGEFAPVSAIAASMAAFKSASEGAAGK